MLLLRERAKFPPARRKAKIAAGIADSFSRTHFGLITRPEEIAAVHSKNEFFEVPIKISKILWNKPPGSNVYIDEDNKFKKKEKFDSRKRQTMNTQDIIKIGRKARIETEAFINRYINDDAKSWPLICHCGSSHNGYHPARQVRKSGIRHILLN